MIIYILTSVCGIVGSVCNTIERYSEITLDKFVPKRCIWRNTPDSMG